MKDVQALLPGTVKVILKDADITGTVTGMPGIAKHSDNLASTFTGLVSDLANGDALSTIQYINRGSIRADVESVLGYKLTPEQAIIAGRQAPSLIEDLVLSRACTIARELQAMRASARKTCQMYQAHGFGSKELHSKLTRFVNDMLDVLNPGEDTGDDEDFETW